MRLEILFLGPASDLAGRDRTTIDVSEGATIADVRRVLAHQHVGLGRALSSIRFAVNEAFATDETPLQDGDEVALIPPVSGGSGESDVLVDIVTEPIDVERVRSSVMGDPKQGAIVTFEGATRQEDDPDHGRLLRLNYEAYESMASKQLETIALEAKRRWSTGRVAIVHRIGVVPPAETSVMIAVACGHRAEGFEACRWLIDTLKKDVPIWKKDEFEDGHVRWVHPNPAEPSE